MGEYAALYLAIASAVAGAGAAIYEGNTQAAAAKSQANAEEFNAQVDANRAKTANEQAGAAEEAKRRENRRLAGAQRAAVAESGIGFDGTSAGVLEQSAVAAEIDALNIRYKGTLESQGFLSDSRLAQQQAKVSRVNAGRAKTGGYVKAASAVLSSYGSYQSGKGGG